MSPPNTEPKVELEPEDDGVLGLVGVDGLGATGGVAWPGPEFEVAFPAAVEPVVPSASDAATPPAAADDALEQIICVNKSYQMNPSRSKSTEVHSSAQMPS